MLYLRVKWSGKPPLQSVLFVFCWLKQWTPSFPVQLLWFSVRFIVDELGVRWDTVSVARILMVFPFKFFLPKQHYCCCIFRHTHTHAHIYIYIKSIKLCSLWICKEVRLEHCRNLDKYLQRFSSVIGSETWCLVSFYQISAESRQKHSVLFLP